MEPHFDKKEGYLQVKINGQYVKDERKRVLKSISNKCKEDDYSKILIDIKDLQLDDDSFERYSSGEEGALYFMKDFRKYIKIALFAQPNKIKGTHLKFGELVARNRGLDYRVFSNEKRALTWLLK